MRKDKCFKQAHDLYEQQEKKKEAQILFKQLRNNHEYTHTVYGFCGQWNKKDSIASISQKIATRVFQIVEEYKKGTRGKPCFKERRDINSIKNKGMSKGALV